MWLLIAFLAPIFYAWSNILDNVLSNQKFKNPFSLVFYSALFNLVFLPIVFLIEHPVLPALSAIPIFIALGLINVGYLYPYYRALQVEDTSIAISFFSLGRIFIPIWAWLIVGEMLAFRQYAGVFLIISSAILLGLDRKRTKFRLSKALWYILAASLILSFESVLLKYLFEQGLGWSTVIGGEMVASFMLSMGLLLHPGFRQGVVSQFTNFRNSVHIFGMEETFTFAAFASEALAIKLAPVSSVKSISMFSPFFALFYASLLGKRFPALFREKTDPGSVLKKIALFTAMVLGVVLIAA